MKFPSPAVAALHAVRSVSGSADLLDAIGNRATVFRRAVAGRFAGGQRITGRWIRDGGRTEIAIGRPDAASYRERERGRVRGARGEAVSDLDGSVVLNGVSRNMRNWLRSTVRTGPARPPCTGTRVADEKVRRSGSNPFICYVLTQMLGEHAMSCGFIRVCRGPVAAEADGRLREPFSQR